MAVEFVIDRDVGHPFTQEKEWDMLHVAYRSDQKLTALDNVFQLLDGKGPVQSYYGPLYDEIQRSLAGTGETEFFKFKCCLNGNLHLEFKKMDLVAKLNAVVGGNRLRKA